MTRQLKISASIKKKFLLYLLLIFIIPLFFFLLLEGILRISGAGYNTNFFTKNKIRGETYYTDNFRFTYTYFPATLASYPNQFVLPLKKSANTTRIFILGESAAMGDPVPFFSFSRILEAMLTEAYPSRKFEIVNTGITAINSHVILPIARACSELEPDFFVIYMGNNEVVGPFGPGTTFLPFQSNMSYIRFFLSLRRTRIGQLMYGIKQSLAKDKSLPKVWGGMEMFTHNDIPVTDKRLLGVYDNFKTNLTDMCQAITDSGAKIILSTVASNLKDCAPFRSGHRKDLSPDEKNQWDNLFQRGKDLQEKGAYGGALTQYISAMSLDTLHAEIHFRAAQCHQILGKGNLARSHFLLARDMDLLRFRADSKINGIIRNFAKTNPDSIILLDAEQKLPNRSTNFITGREIFLDHVHFNFHGNYVLARAVFKIINSKLGNSQVMVLSEIACANRLAFTRWEDYYLQKTVVDIYNSSPFIFQFNNKQLRQQAQSKLKMMGNHLTPDVLKLDNEIYYQAIKNNAQDWMLRLNYGNFLLSVVKDASSAVGAFQSVLEDLPYSFLPYHLIGNIMTSQGKYQEAIDYYKKSLNIRPEYVAAHQSIGETYYQTGNFAKALYHLEKAFVSEERLEMVRNKIKGKEKNN